ncbi:MAG: hypothetical protein K8T26_08155 [Lentisphaerae bacterium]|nr:hypothetical protein [Lentisphaerota bacterium]
MKRILKGILLTIGGILAALTVLSTIGLLHLWYIGDLGNWGLELGHYGQYNRVRHVLDAMPNVHMVSGELSQSAPPKPVMHEFAFWLTVEGYDGPALRIEFKKGSPQMNMRNKTQIRTFILEQLKAGSNRLPATDP